MCILYKHAQFFAHSVFSVRRPTHILILLGKLTVFVTYYLFCSVFHLIGSVYVLKLRLGIAVRFLVGSPVVLLVLLFFLWQGVILASPLPPPLTLP
jgi:hypothetical protein